MKATLTALKEYQDVLCRMAELEKLLAMVPNEIKDLEKEWRVVESRIKDLETRDAEQASKIKDQEIALEEATQKAEKFENDLKEVTNGKEYNAVLKEIDTVKKKISSISEDLSERREDLSSIRTNLEENRQLEAESNKKYEAALAAHRESQGDYAKELEVRKHSKNKLGDGLPPKLMKQFDRIASRRNGIGLASCLSSVCSACNVRVRQSVVDQLRAHATVIQCESCQRILYFEDTVTE